MNSVRIISYNIHKGMSPLNRMVKLNDMGRALLGVAPDILCLQEVSGQNLKRAMAFDDYPDQSQHAWFAEFLDLADSYGKNMEYEHGHHGNATLSKHPLDPKHNVNITVNRLEKRGVLHSEIQPVGWDKPIVVLNAHLNLLHKDRVKQYQAIIDYVNNEIDKDSPLVLAGDFNDWNKKSAKDLKALGLQEVFHVVHGQYFATFPAKLPLLSLDRIYVKNLNIKEAMVYTGKPWADLSDHLPIGVVVSP